MIRAAACGLVVLVAAVAHAAPEDAGALAVTKTTVQVPVGGAVQLATDLYVPQAAGPFPTVLMRHGFARTKANFAGWGQHLASRGFTVLVPTSRTPLSPNPDVDSNDMLAVLAWAVAQSDVAGSPLAGKVDAARRGVTGHSAGGLAATLAASKEPTLRCAVLFDEVDDLAGAGVAAAPGIAIPTISLFAEPGNCNASSNGVAIFQAIGGPKYGIKIPGSQHCDPEDPSDALCGAACNGNVQPQYQLLYRRYATAFLEAFLKCDPAAYPYVNGATAQGDPGITIDAATDVVVPPPVCAALPTDGGTPPGDAAPADAPPSLDAAESADAADAPADAGPPAQPDGGTGQDGGGTGQDGGGTGGGCRAAAGAPGTLGLVALALLLAARRRRP